MAFPNTDFKIVSTKLEKELIFKTRTVDTIVKILVNDQDHLVHFEFQSEYDRHIGERIFIYAGALTAKYKMGVTSILYQLKPPPKSIQTLDTYNVHLFGLVTNSFRFHCVKLWEYYQEILTGKKEYLGLVPLFLDVSDHRIIIIIHFSRIINDCHIA